MSFIAVGLICFTPAQRLLFFKDQNKRLAESHEERVAGATDIKGYRDIVFYNGKFLAVGTDGRIDLINNSGERPPVINTCKNNLNWVISEDQVMALIGKLQTTIKSIQGIVNHAYLRRYLLRRTGL